MHSQKNQQVDTQIIRNFINEYNKDHDRDVHQDTLDWNGTKGVFENKEELIKALKKLKNSTNYKIIIQNNIDKQENAWIREESSKATIRCHPDAIIGMIAFLKSDDKSENSENLKVLSWNIGISWGNTEHYEGAWRYEQVTEVIHKESPHCIFLQEVPLYETSLGRFNFHDRLKDCLEEWGYSVFSARGEKILMLTAFKKSLFTRLEEQVICRGRTHPTEYHIRCSVNKRPINIDTLINVHLKYRKDLGEANRQMEILLEKNSGAMIIAGDFNCDSNKKKSECSSGAKFNSEGKVEGWDNFDHIYSYSKDLDIIIPEYAKEPIFPPGADTKPAPGAHFHRPICAELNLR